MKMSSESMKGIIIILFFFITNIGFSCSCVGGYEMREFNIIDYLNYDEILFGVVKSKDKCHSQSINIIESFKNGLTGELLIYNESSTNCNSSCDSEYFIGDTVLFYLLKKSNTWVNVICSKTIDLKYLPVRYEEYKMGRMGLYTYSIHSLRYLKDHSTNYFQEMKYPNGNLIYKGKVINGSSHGEWIFYNQTGTISSKGNYQKGQKIGQWEYFYYDSKDLYTKIIGYWDGNIKIGKWQYYDKDNKLIKEELYNYGQFKVIK